MNKHDYHISWVAPEYDHREHTADWYWAAGIISVSLAVAFIIIGNTLLSIILILGVSTLLYYAKHPPKNVEYKISKKGINAGKTFYPWDTLDSFWILEGHHSRGMYCSPKILLISKKTLMPHIVILLNESILEETHEVLSHMLHEEPQAEPLHDRIMHMLGF